MTWMTLSTGTEMPLHKPELKHVCLNTIAHHIAQINRFNGAACRPYSVAEHSMLTLDIARNVLHLPILGQLAVLLHDAHEAYCGDVIYPIKDRIRSAWKPLEDSFAQLVAWHFDVTTLMHEHRASIELADRIALAIERRDLLPSEQPDGTPLSPWPILYGISVPEGYDLLTPERADKPWHRWRDEFAWSVRELQHQRMCLIRKSLNAA